jgi:NAD(P)-dependent dehydrogenase (short-subunit alcohol dehydrogenase family)
MRLKKTIASVTGGRSGIVLETSIAFARERTSVVVNDANARAFKNSSAILLPLFKRTAYRLSVFIYATD